MSEARREGEGAKSEFERVAAFAAGKPYGVVNPAALSHRE